MLSTTHRRYDIDWLRVIAIGLLLIYHVAIVFQPWGIMIGFITAERPWTALWVPMAMLNVWRIPLLFFVSGMGVYFALRQRSWSGLLMERTRRILVPFLFGAVFIFPPAALMWQRYYHFPVSYNIHPGHLWFLGNIFVYVVLLSPVFFYLKHHEQGVMARAIKWSMGNPLGLALVVAASVGEALWVGPNPYEMYGLTWHGFWLGLLAFFFGFCFVFSGERFQVMMQKGRWLFLVAAVALFVVRLQHFGLRAPGYLVAMESDCWIFAVLGWGSKYLNRPGCALNYLSRAAYPVYIVHLVFLFAGAWLILPQNLPPPVQFLLILLFTIASCLGAYELIRRSRFIRPLFGLRKE